MSGGSHERVQARTAASSDLAAAARRIAGFRESLGGKALGEKAVRLACHAALPVVVNAELLNLLRVNFFLDPPDDLPYEVEAALLLSGLFREIGEGLYEIEPGLRNVLLSALQTHPRYGFDRVRRVSALLEQYTESSVAWRDLPELAAAQRLTAVNFLDPPLAEQWLSGVGPVADAALNREWYVAMRRRIDEQSVLTSVGTEIGDLCQRLLDPERSADERLALIRDLDALARLPEADTNEVVSGLTRFIEAWDAQSPPSKRVTPDVQAALTLIGTLPHSGFHLEDVKLFGANLAGLDFSRSSLDGVVMSRVDARGINLTSVAWHEGELADVVLDGARLDGASLRFHSMRRVSLAGVSLAGSVIRVDLAEDVTGTDANGTPFAIVAPDATEDALGAPDDGAAKAYDMLLGRTGVPESLDELLERARPAEAASDWELARDLYQQAVDTTGGEDPEVLIGLARAHARLGVLSDAIRRYQQAIDVCTRHLNFDLKPVHAEALMGLGNIWLTVGRPEQARQQFLDAVTICRLNHNRVSEGRALLNAGAASLALRDGSSAERQYRQALAAFREAGSRHDLASANAGIADALAERGKFADAAESAATAASIFREGGDLREEATVSRRIAKACAIAGQHGLASTLYERALAASSEAAGADHPDTVAIGRALAVELTKEGDRLAAAGRLADAESSYQAALAHNPGLVEAHSGMGGVRLAAGDFFGAQQAFAKARRAAPGDARARRGLGEAMQRGGLFPTALGQLLARDGSVVGACFQVAPGVLVTAADFIIDLKEPVIVAAPSPHSTTPRFEAAVVHYAAARGVAVLLRAIEEQPMERAGTAPLSSWLPLFAPADSVLAGESVDVYTLEPERGLPTVTVGQWTGAGYSGATASVTVDSELRSISAATGAPVVRHRDGAILGMILGVRSPRPHPRQPGTALAVVRAEDIVALLDGLAEVTLLDDPPPGSSPKA